MIATCVRMRDDLLEQIDSLELPANFLDALIDQLGGPGQCICNGLSVPGVCMMPERSFYIGITKGRLGVCKLSCHLSITATSRGQFMLEGSAAFGINQKGAHGVVAAS